MLKKAGHITLAFMLLILTTGMTITGHYCGNMLVSVNILSEPDQCCDNNNCCHNETVTIKLDTNIINSSYNYSFKISSSTLLIASESILNYNSFPDRNLTESIIRFLNLPPFKLNTFLSKLGSFLL